MRQSLANASHVTLVEEKRLRIATIIRDSVDASSSPIATLVRDEGARSRRSPARVRSPDRRSLARLDRAYAATPPPSGILRPNVLALINVLLSSRNTWLLCPAPNAGTAASTNESHPACRVSAAQRWQFGYLVGGESPSVRTVGRNLNEAVA
jgi:hypothetical protein